MKSKLFLTIFALATALMSGAAVARTHWDFGLYLGPGYWPYYAPYSYYPPYAPYYYSPYYYPPYPPYYYPPAQPAPPVVIEQSAPPPPAPAAENWWYYCAGSRTYYPYVRECAGGWQRVSPTPPDAAAQ